MINALKKYAEVEEHVTLKNLNTYRIGGTAKLLVTPNSISDLTNVIKILKDNNEKYFILGNGSNIVLNDREYDGAVIKLSKLNGIEVHPELNMAYAEAGAMLPILVNECVKRSLTGLEFAAGIPGTVGGSIYGNAGAYNACILDYVKLVTVLDENLEVQTIEHENINYAYRTSMFKTF